MSMAAAGAILSSASASHKSDDGTSPVPAASPAQKVQDIFGEMRSKACGAASEMRSKASEKASTAVAAAEGVRSSARAVQQCVAVAAKQRAGAAKDKMDAGVAAAEGIRSKAVTAVAAASDKVQQRVDAAKDTAAKVQQRVDAAKDTLRDAQAKTKASFEAARSPLDGPLTNRMLFKRKLQASRDSWTTSGASSSREESDVIPTLETFSASAGEFVYDSPDGFVDMELQQALVASIIDANRLSSFNSEVLESSTTSSSSHAEVPGPPVQPWQLRPSVGTWLVAIDDEDKESVAAEIVDAAKADCRLAVEIAVELAAVELADNELDSTTTVEVDESASSVREKAAKIHEDTLTRMALSSAGVGFSWSEEEVIHNADLEDESASSVRETAAKILDDANADGRLVAELAKLRSVSTEVVEATTPSKSYAMTASRSSPVRGGA